MSLTIAIVGRPNVGKSTLFNRLVGRRLALVDDTPGMTRDWRSSEASVGGLRFTVLDTAGLEEAAVDSLEARMRRQTEQAITDADVILFLIDARAGVTPLDHHFADWLRQRDQPVILIANKAEGQSGTAGVLDAFSLGLGEPVPLSAEHGEGLADLVEALLPFAADDDDTAGTRDTGPNNAADPSDEATSTDHTVPDHRPIGLAIVGRPNVGKSTLLNALIGETRVLAGPEAGMTRDAIAVDWHWGDRAIRLVDTAGLRKRSRVDSPLEQLAVQDTLRVIRHAHVVTLLMEPEAALERQDLTIARMVLEEGRSLVIGVNKWDITADRQAAIDQLKDRLTTSLPQARGVPWVTLSALTGTGLDRLLNTVVSVYDLWNRRLSTAQLNRWLEEMARRHPPPLIDGRTIKLRYMTQVKARPPTFALWVSKPVALPDSYQRYLVQGLRTTFDLPGIPIRLLLRKGKNPYVTDPHDRGLRK